MKRLLLIFSIIIFTCLLRAEPIRIFDSYKKDAFPLHKSIINVENKDFTVVHKTASMLGDDMETVFGKRENFASRFPIIIGTLGHNSIIDSLANAGVIPADSIRGKWERFIIKSLPDMLVIAGSDRRGTAFGMMTLSETIGVSPWVWWADVPVKKQENLWIDADFISSAPSVKYRGLFINDEDWGLKPWSSDNFEKELGDIGPKTYERISQLLLRLRLNMLAPAMHSCTGAFYQYPESKQVLDEYGIIVTTSHCEPMLFNNASLYEWDKQRDGEWNYRTNRETILGKFDSRLSEASMYENIYTIAMRGVHDEGIKGDFSLDDRISILSDVIKDQRDLLAKHFGCSPDTIPQIFVPYKETLDLYKAGLELPEDVTIVWPDDNYGYMKQLSDSTEMKRNGGSGVYYHLSYLGTPHDYLWLCTTPPQLMYQELNKAFNRGADRYWLLNVGDIKPGELDIQTFADMAWNFKIFDETNIVSYQPAMLSAIFGLQYLDDLTTILNEYYRLAWSRKPEYMGWEYEWDKPEFTKIRPAEFSATNYNELQRRLSDYDHIATLTQSIMDSLPESLVPAFYQMVGYPVMASREINRKYLMYTLNQQYADAGELAKANYCARKCKAAHDKISELTDYYNSMLDGKWRGMMDVPPGFVAIYQDMPELKEFPSEEETIIDLNVYPEKDIVSDCCVVDLNSYISNLNASILTGIGYDGFSLKLGDQAIEEDSIPFATYRIPEINSDSITVKIYHLPFFPIDKYHSTRIAVSVDSHETQSHAFIPIEWSGEWKENVLRNSAITEFKFKIDKKKKNHILTISSPDPGNVIQKLIIDWGGLKSSYTGPYIRPIKTSCCVNKID